MALIPEARFRERRDDPPFVGRTGIVDLAGIARGRNGCRIDQQCNF
jgi:hypothetical protein